MADLGSGSTPRSDYPSKLDTNVNLEFDAPAGNKTKVRADVPNDLAQAIINIQQELGTDPAGSLTDVKTYLQTEHNADGTHDSSLVAMLAANNVFTGTNTFQGAVNYGTATGTDTYVLTLSPAIASLATGAEFKVEFTNANTVVAPTLNVNATGAKTIKNADGNELDVGQLTAGEQTTLRYDGTDFLIMSVGLVANAELEANATGLTVTSGFGDLSGVSINVGTVAAGLRFFTSAYMNGTKGGTAGDTRLFITSTGTSTIQAYGSSTGITAGYEVVASTIFNISDAALFRVTGAGTLTVKLQGRSDGSNSTGVGAGLQVWVVKI